MEGLSTLCPSCPQETKHASPLDRTPCTMTMCGALPLPALHSAPPPTCSSLAHAVILRSHLSEREAAAGHLMMAHDLSLAVHVWLWRTGSASLRPLHVHVGFCRRVVAYSDLERASALLWAAERRLGLLVSMS